MSRLPCPSAAADAALVAEFSAAVESTWVAADTSGVAGAGDARSGGRAVVSAWLSRMDLVPQSTQRAAGCQLRIAPCAGCSAAVHLGVLQLCPASHRTSLPPPPRPTPQLSLDMLTLPGGAAALRLWSAELPHLYLLLLSLVEGDGSGSSQPIEIEACQVSGGGPTDLWAGERCRLHLLSAVCE